jgi:hypothetical protein
MVTADLIVMIFWSFMIITIVLSVGVMWEGMFRILSNPRIVRTIVRLLKLGITKMKKSIKKLITITIISNNSMVRSIVFAENTPLKNNAQIHTQSRI